MQNKIMFFVFICMMSFTVVNGQDAYQQIDMIKQIQSLTRDSASWQPGLTTHSQLSAEEVSKLCGLFLLPKNNQTPSTKNQMEIDALSTVSFRSKKRDLRDLGYITPVKDQGDCGSCWAFACVANIEAALKKKRGTTHDLSEQHVVSCARSLFVKGCDGAANRPAAKLIHNSRGVVLEEKYPYISGQTKKTEKCDRSQLQGQRYKTDHLFFPENSTVIRKCIDKGYPVVVGMYVYEDFKHYTSGIYRHATGKFLGGHAVLIVGYNNENRYWIVKNSWGTGWGENGFFKIAYGQSNLPMKNMSLVFYMDKNKSR